MLALDDLSRNQHETCRAEVLSLLANDYETAVWIGDERYTESSQYPGEERYSYPLGLGYNILLSILLSSKLVSRLANPKVM